MPCSWQQWTNQNQFHTLILNVLYSEKCSCNGKKRDIYSSLLDRGADGELFVEGWCIHTSTPTSCHMEWHERSDLSLDVAAMFTHGGSCCSNTWFYCDNIMVFQGQCSHWNEIFYVGKEKKPSTIGQPHRQWRMWIQSCLSRPLMSVWLFFNAFTPAIFFSPFTIHEQRDSWSLSTPHPHPSPVWSLHPPPKPMLTPLHCFPLPASRLCSSLPLSSVSPSFLVAVSLW